MLYQLSYSCLNLLGLGADRAGRQLVRKLANRVNCPTENPL